MECLGSKPGGLQGPRTRCWWCAAISVILMILGVLIGRPGYGEVSSQSPQPGASAPRQPPAMPLATSERVLELSLEDAIRLALQYNLDIERERLEPQIAHTEVEKARAAFDPVLSVDAEISDTQFLPVQEFRTAPGDFEPIQQASTDALITPLLTQKIVTGADYEIRFINTFEDVSPERSGDISRLIANPRYESHIELAFTQPLLQNFGIAVNTAPIRQAQQTEEKAEQQVVQTILDVVFEVQQGYWELVFRMQDLEAKRESQQLAEDFLAENTIRVELGTLAPIELVQAETEVKTREGDVIVAEAAVQEAEDELKEVINLPETLGTWDIRLRPTDSPPFEPLSTVSVAEHVAAALQHRPDVIQLQLDIASRQIDQQVARNQRLPKLDLELTTSVSALGDDAGESVPNLVDGEGYEWSIGLRFEQPLGNRFARNELQRRNLQLKQALIDQRKLQRTIVREIRQAIRDIETARKRVEVTRASTTLERTQLEAEQEKFRLGLSTSFNVLTFQEDLTIARSEETQAVSDFNVALARLDQLTGTLRYGEVSASKAR
ncbi:hypothetical protein NKDENANG_02302 [Candidatus Entotheonellaceae bacterium PAL068K]